MFGRRRLACSFCGKPAGEVGKLVADPRVFICDACVAVASRIMQEDATREPTSGGAAPSFLHRVWSGIHRAIGGERTP